MSDVNASSRGEAAGVTPASGPAGSAGKVPASPGSMDIAAAHALEMRRVERPAVSEVPDAQAPAVGLALSGGGIRSATFSLGVLQTLAKHEKLRSFDFLSTVSGGGYIGSWLSAWIYRKGLLAVERQLACTGSKPGTLAPTAAEPAEVAWLRRYSNYLTPRVGLTSVDSLTLLTTWLRNVTLNAVIIFGFLVFLLLLPFEALKLVRWACDSYIAAGFAAVIFGIFFFAGIAYDLWHQSIANKRSQNKLLSTPGVLGMVVLPGVLACCTSAVWLFHSEPKTTDIALFALLYTVGLLLVIFVSCIGAQVLLKPKPDRTSASGAAIALMAGIIALAVGTGVLAGFYFAWHAGFGPERSAQHLVAMLCLGAPAMIFAFTAATTTFTGMMGRLYYERSREWWSRLNAWLLSLASGWVIWVALAFFSLPLLRWIAGEMGNWVALAGTGWIGSLLTATLFRKPEGGSKRLQANVDTLLNIAASVFVAGLLIVVSALVCWAVFAINELPLPALPDAPPAKTTYELLGTDAKLAYSVRPENKGGPRFLTLVADQTTQLERLIKPEADQSTPEAPSPDTRTAGARAPGPTLAALEQTFDMTDAMLLATALLSLLFSWRVDINKFSLHNMYKNRLVRCYLGASNQISRNEQPFTGLDDADDLLLSLLNGDRPPPATPSMPPRPPQRPIHIINTTLNITQGKNLAWQERKAASFVFTPVVCGYALERTQGDSTSVDLGDTQMSGYRATKDYASNDREEQGFTLGMALATSGAAVSPNMGHATSRARAFVLTLFNVRLGRWSPNPAKNAWQRPSPRFGLAPMLQELFGYSNEERDFVYLSDGGHFENLGLYELVRRRCKTVVVVDAGADPGRSMGDIGEAVKKCRIDLGVEIELPELSLLAGDADERAQQGFMKGVIRYDLGDPSRDGTLILIKPTMTRCKREPADVLNYAELHPTFPQQTTADQFFDESQFESYRRLGCFVAEECMKQHRALLPAFAGVPYLPGKDERPADPAANSSKWIARLMTRKAPGRDGCLVDMVVVLLSSVVVLALVRMLLEWLLLGTPVGPCWNPESCRGSLRLFLESSTTVQTDALATFDCFFAVFYAGALASACAVVLDARNRAAISARTNDARVPVWRYRVAFVGMLFAALTAAFALGEDTQILGWTQTTGEAPSDFAADIGTLAFLKFAGIALCLVSLAVLAPSIRRVFRARWATAEPLRPASADTR